MEKGLRQAVPRRMITRFEALADGEPLFTADFRNGTSASPYVAFVACLAKTMTITFLRLEEEGREHRASQRVTVA